MRKEKYRMREEGTSKPREEEVVEEIHRATTLANNNDPLSTRRSRIHSPEE
jgi:hypothetical protein